MSVLGLHHVSVLVADTARSVDFYRAVLGLEVDPGRPDLGYPGAWLSLGEQQIHLLELPNPDPISGRPAHGGRDRHLALWVDDVEALEAALLARSVAFSRSRSGRRALFFRDPDGNAIECVERQV